MLVLPYELVYEILLHAIVQDFHELCTTDYRRYGRRSTIILAVALRVCREFRFIARKITLFTICGGVHIGYPHEPVRLDRLLPVFDYLCQISPTNYKRFQSERGLEEIAFSPEATVLVGGIYLNNMNGLIRLYWNISRGHIICFSALRFGMQQPARWMTLLRKLTDLVRSERSDFDYDLEEEITSTIVKYRADYQTIHLAALTYLSSLPGWSVNEAERTRSYSIFLHNVNYYTSSFDKMRRLSPDLLYDMFSTTGLGGLLEEGSRIKPLRSQAATLNRRWMPFLLNYRHRSSRWTNA